MKDKPKNKRASMPSKAAIRDAWQRFAFDIPQDVWNCWGCVFGTPTERAHIHAVHAGGSNDPENMVLLCRACHTAQETICSTLEGRENFRAAIIDGAPFVKARVEYLTAQVQLMGDSWKTDNKQTTLI